jgi:hypothetical protein
VSEWLWVWAGYGIAAATWAGYVAWALHGPTTGGSRRTER